MLEEHGAIQRSGCRQMAERTAPRWELLTRSATRRHCRTGGARRKNRSGTVYVRTVFAVR